MRQHSIDFKSLSVVLAIFSYSLFFIVQSFGQDDFQKSKSGIRLPGHQTDGSTLLPNGWSLRPAGQQIEMGDVPVHVETAPEGRFCFGASRRLWYS